MDKRFIETFIEESYELLDSMEKELLALEAEPDDEGHIQAVFRAAHTIKGSAAMFGFQEISEFAHAFRDGAGRGPFRNPQNQPGTDEPVPPGKGSSAGSSRCDPEQRNRIRERCSEREGFDYPEGTFQDLRHGKGI